MKSVLLFGLFACSALMVAQTPQMKSGATVYIEPADGYEAYLAAAIMKKHVPLVLTADKSKADYVIVSNIGEDAVARVTFTIASITVAERRSSRIVFGASAKGTVIRTAEACAQHLKQFIEHGK